MQDKCVCVFAPNDLMFTLPKTGLLCNGLIISRPAADYFQQNASSWNSHFAPAEKDVHTELLAGKPA